MAGIVMVVGEFPKATETFIVSKFFGLLERGWDVHLSCAAYSPESWSFYPMRTVTPAIEERIHVRTRTAVSFEDVDPLIVHYEFGNVAHRLIGRLSAPNGSIVVSFRGRDIESHLREQPDAYRAVWEHTDMVHVVGESLRQTALERGCPLEMPVHVIPSSIDTIAFDFPKRRHDAVLGTSDCPVRITTIARLHWKKGLIYALEAVRLLADRGIRCHYTIVGDGADFEYVRFTIDDLGLSENVVLAGLVPQAGVIDVLRRTDIYLQPSVSEGFCNAALEAASMKLPVVATDAGSLPENVAHARTGFIVPRRNPGAIADAVAELAGDPGMRKRMATAGRARVRKRFDVPNQLDKIEAMYQDVLVRRAEHIVSSNASHEAGTER